MTDNNPITRVVHPKYRVSGLSERLEVALAGRDKAWLSRESGVSTSAISDYARGTVPSADRAFALADALGVSVRWLVMGEQELSGPPELGDEWMMLPFYDVQRIAPGALPKPEYHTPIRRELVRSLPYGLDDKPFWLTSMPSRLEGESPRFGETIICQSVDSLMHDGALYLLAMSGVVVRRFDPFSMARLKDTPFDRPLGLVCGRYLAAT